MSALTKLHINGLEYSIDFEPSRPVLLVLRNDLGLTGTKAGCSLGQCGACTILVNGKAERACLTPAETLTGKPIVTIEGLEDHPLQPAFIDEQAAQCGYCITGIIMTAAGLLREQPSPSMADIKAALKDNLCRCGTHSRILSAISRAAEVMAESNHDG